MNPGFEHLQPYPFEKLDALFDGCTPPQDKSRIALSIGEPRHAPYAQSLISLCEHLTDGAARYPTMRGLDALRQACADWLGRRFAVNVDAHSMLLPVTGTREALFAIAQALIDPSANEAVLLPNPFYQIYEGAALMAGAEPVYLNNLPENNYLADLDAIDEKTWARTKLFYICSPGNPSGNIVGIDYYKQLIALADKYDFYIAADECYAELYRGDPPPSILNACDAMGRNNYERVLAFHSLSKRSNLPGLRSGFVAGDPTLIAQFLRYRTYHGCSMSLPTQYASIAAWSDDEHVVQNRALYAEKYAAVVPILKQVMQVESPLGSFYLWPKIGDDDQAFARELYRNEHVVTLPGSYLARTVDSINPGAGRVRMSLVASLDDCLQAAHRIQHFCQQFGAC